MVNFGLRRQHDSKLIADTVFKGSKVMLWKLFVIYDVVLWISAIMCQSSISTGILWSANLQATDQYLVQLYAMWNCIKECWVQCCVSVGADSDQAVADTLIDEYQRQLSSKAMNRQGLRSLTAISVFMTGICRLALVTLYGEHYHNSTVLPCAMSFCSTSVHCVQMCIYTGTQMCHLRMTLSTPSSTQPNLVAPLCFGCSCLCSQHQQCC